jgi:hypothetical protein
VAEHVEVVVEHVEGSARDGGRKAPGKVGKGTRGAFSKTGRKIFDLRVNKPLMVHTGVHCTCGNKTRASLEREIMTVVQNIENLYLVLTEL